MNQLTKVNSRKQISLQQAIILSYSIQQTHQFPQISLQSTQSYVSSENQKDFDDRVITGKKQLFLDGKDQNTKCQNCQQLQAVVKRLTLENQNLTYQIGFKDIAMKTREDMINSLSKDHQIQRVQMRQLEQSKNWIEPNEIIKQKNVITTDRENNKRKGQNSLPKLKNQQVSPVKAIFSSQQNNKLIVPNQAIGKKQIASQNLSKTQSIVPSKESLIYEEEDEDNQLQRVEIGLHKKQLSSTIAHNIYSPQILSQNDLERANSQHELTIIDRLASERKQSLVKSSSRLSFSPQKRPSLSPFKLLMKGSNNQEFFDSSIYKSLDQLKSYKYSQERKFLEDQVRSVEDFAENIVREQYQVRIKIAEDIRHLLRDYIKVLDQSIVLKKIQQSSSRINRCYKAQEVVNAITEEVMNNIECEHAIFYIKDQYNQILWTIDKNNQNQMIKVDPKQGILMHTLQSEKTYRVDDVDFDPRFSKEYDSCYYRNIKNMICIPLKDKSNIIRGVLQIINYKKSDFQVSQDEILKLLTENCAAQLLSVFEFEQAIHNNHRVMKLMEVTKEINYLQDEIQIIDKAKELLTKAFLTPLAVIYLIKDGSILINNKDKYPLNSGVIGEALSQMKIVETLDQLSHPNANFNIDIETVLPTISVPIITQNKKLIAVFQIVQDAFVRSNSIPKEQIFYFDSLQFFADLLAFNIERCQKNIQSQQ